MIITTIKIVWSLIGTNFHLVSIKANKKLTVTF